MLANFETYEARRLSFTVKEEQWGQSQVFPMILRFSQGQGTFFSLVFGFEWDTHGAERRSACVGHGCQRVPARSVFSTSAKGHLAHLDKKARTWRKCSSTEQVDMTCLVKPDKVWCFQGYCIYCTEKLEQNNPWWTLIPFFVCFSHRKNRHHCIKRESFKSWRLLILDTNISDHISKLLKSTSFLTHSRFFFLQYETTHLLFDVSSPR